MPKILHIAALSAFIAALAHGDTPVQPEPPTVSDDYVLRAWDTTHNLPDNNVSGLAQTPDGYMWFATRAGFVRFDGARFTVFGKDTTSGLESNNVRTLYVALDGTLWLGLERGGVARWDGTRCTVIVPMQPKGAVIRWVSSFAEDREGGIWFGFGFGLVPDARVQRWHQGKLTGFTLEDGLPGGQDTYVHADISGSIWVATKSGCAFFDGTKFQQPDRGGGPLVRLAPARSGGMWATRGDRLLRYRADGSKEDIADITQLGGSTDITALFEDRDGTLWIGTSGLGLCRFGRGRFQRVPSAHSFILAIGEDRAGNLWASTQGGGVSMLRARRFVLRGRSRGLSKDNVGSLCTDAAGTLWIAPRWALPVRAVSAQNKDFAPLESWYARNVTTICPDRDGGVWIGHDGGFVAHLREGVVTQPEFRTADVNRVETLLVDSTGDLWIATMDGPLVRWRDEVEEPQPTDTGLVRVRALAEDAAGRLWAGTDEGALFRRENGRFVSVPVPDTQPGQAIRFIVADAPDTVWIGTLDGGLLRWRSGAFARWDASRGLPDLDLRALVIDDSRNLWLATSRGLYRANRQLLDRVLEGEQPSLRPVIYGASDGVPNVGFAFEAGRNTTARTRDGRLWFATDRGALEVQEPRRVDEAPPAPIRIEDMRVDGALLPLANAQVAPAPRRIEFHYTAPYFGTPERIHFRYRLAGMDDTWINAGTERTATFARLPPGRYRFEVAATDAEGEWQPWQREGFADAEVGSAASQWKPEIASIVFTVRPAWWETLWVRALVALAAATLIAASVRIIVKRRMRRRLLALEQEHALERERIRIARDMHDQLGASLTQISIATQLVKLDKPEAVAGHVDEISAVARRTVESLDEIVWAVDPRHDTLASLVEYLGKFALGFLTSSGLIAKVDIPHNLPPTPLGSNVRHHLFLAVREALNNVVKHAGATTVWLHVEMKGGVLRVIVTDDGRGFDGSTVQADSNGLRNMRERLAEIHGQCRIDGNPTAGTRVICELPLGTNGA